MSLVPPGLAGRRRKESRQSRRRPGCAGIRSSIPGARTGVQPSVLVAGLPLLDCAHLPVAADGALVQRLRAHRDDDARRRPTNRAKAASMRHARKPRMLCEVPPRPSPRSQQANDRVPGKCLTVGQRHGRIPGVSRKATALVALSGIAGALQASLTIDGDIASEGALPLSSRQPLLVIVGFAADSPRGAVGVHSDSGTEF
jgi:hypothetical protein